MNVRPIDRLRKRADQNQQRVPKRAWADSFLRNVSLVTTVVATAGYLLGYWFLDGYLAGYGYSMRAIPHDYPAVMMELFLLFLHAGIALFKQEWLALLAALLVGCVLTLYVALIFWFANTKYSDKLVGKRTISDRARAWIGLVFVGASPVAIVLVVLALIAVVVLPVALTNEFGKAVAREEIANFSPCASRAAKASCISLSQDGGPPIAGTVVAGTDDLLLVYDGSIAHLLKRSDSLRGAVRGRCPRFC